MPRLAPVIFAALLTAAQAEPIETVVVTATRHAEALGKVPESVGVLTASQLDTFDLKNIADAVHFLPGVTFDSTTNAVSIRGISSAAGAGTTGLYIDDVPIQMRTLDYNSDDTLPVVFDLDRIEVLRGPQGTLFGAGAEGGALRYITAQPGLDDFSARARAETSAGRNGAINYEAGVALNAPVTDDVAVRFSAWDRHDGGTIGKIGGTNNANSADTLAVRGAALWTPLAGLTVTLSDFHQDRIRHDTDSYWVAASRPGHLVSGTPEALGDRDHFNLSVLKLDYDFGGAELISDTSYFTRLQRVQGYSGTLYDLSYFQQLTAAGTDPSGGPCTAGACAAGLYPLLTANGFNLPGFGPYQAVATVTNRQKNFVQEVRLQSDDAAARLVWTAGVYYGLATQHAVDAVYDPQLPDITQYLFGADMMTIWGENLLPGGIEFINATVAHDRQIAAYANASFAVTPQLKLQGGARYAHTEFDFRNTSDGPQNFGPDGGTGRKSEDPVTYTAGLVYTPNDDAMLYATYSTGYRIGGANEPFPQAACQADLNALGISSVPETYDSDRVESFEAGSKDRLLGGRLMLGGSAFHLTWSHMQQSNYLSSCGFQYVANFGTATSNGFDLEADWLVSDVFDLHLSAGYTDAHFTRDSLSGSGAGAAIIAHRGDALPGAPWTVEADGLYRFTLGGVPFAVRADYAFASRNGRQSPQTDPLTTQYDPGAVADPSTGIAGLSLEATLDAAQMRLFVDNLFDSQPQLGLNHQDRYTLLYEATTLRPRTIGVSLGYKY